MKVLREFKYYKLEIVLALILVILFYGFLFLIIYIGGLI